MAPFEREIELELEWGGWALLAYVTYRVGGHLTKYYRETLTSPEEPSVFAVDREEYQIGEVRDENDQLVHLTAPLRRHILSQVELAMERDQDENLRQWTADADDEAEASREAAEEARAERRWEERTGVTMLEAEARQRLAEREGRDRAREE